MSLFDIREAARAMEADTVGRMLASGNSWPLDSVASEVVEVVRDRNAPTGERIVEQYVLPSELTLRLAENGCDRTNDVERRKVAHAVLMAKASAYRSIEFRKKGLAVETPPRPASIVAVEGGEKFPTILEMHDIWAERVKPDRKTRDDNKLYISSFVSMHGDLGVDKIKRKHIRDFRDKLKSFRPFRAIGGSRRATLRRLPSS
jgi:hypothetical protein